MNKKIILAVISIFLFGGIFLFSKVAEKKELPCVKELPQNISVEKNISKAEAAEEDIFAGMDDAIKNILNDGSDYAVYIAYPAISERRHIFSTTTQKFRSASMIKVFILATAMEKVKSGELNLYQKMTIETQNKVGGAGILAGYSAGTQLTMQEVLKDMIIYSDNTATNMMIDLLGMDAVNKYLRDNGYNDTILQRKMMDFNGRENYTSANDLGNFFMRLYKNSKSETGGSYDQLMLEILKEQTDTECLNAACPDKTVAHKTGALVGTFSDGGIIFGGKNGDTVLIMMSENFTGEKIVIDRMKKLAKYIIY